MTWFGSATHIRLFFQKLKMNCFDLEGSVCYDAFHSIHYKNSMKCTFNTFLCYRSKKFCGYFYYILYAKIELIPNKCLKGILLADNRVSVVNIPNAQYGFLCAFQFSCHYIRLYFFFEITDLLYFRSLHSNKII